MKNDTNAIAYAVWNTADGSTHLWPQGTKDNKRERIVSRILRYGMVNEESEILNLAIFATYSEADNYAIELRSVI